MDEDIDTFPSVDPVLPDDDEDLKDDAECVSDEEIE